MSDRRGALATCALLALCALATLCVLPAACSSDPAEDPPPEGRPGDSLFDRLDTASVLEYPITNLAPRVAAVVDAAWRAHVDAGGPSNTESGTVRFSTLELDNWVFGRLLEDDRLPAHMRGFLPTDRTLRLYTALPGVRPAPGTGAPLILRDGRPIPDWSPGEPFPESWLMWDDEHGALRAFATEPPTGVQLVYRAAAADEFGHLERRLALDADPRALDLLHSCELDGVSRPCLLLPPPGRLAIPLGRLEADKLELAFGVLDEAWRVAARDDASLQRTTGASDGVLFAIEVESGDRTDRVWSGRIRPEDVGRSFHDISVDISLWRGRDVTIHLVTATPERGRPDHGWAVWGNLRLSGKTRRQPERPHVVLIDIDTLRPDRMGCYGYARPTTPRLDAWIAENAVIYEDARTTGPYTLPATASIMTGLDTHQHDVDHLSKAIGPGLEPIAQRLRAAGYETCGIAEGAYLRSAFGFDTGFDEYVTAPHKRPDWSAAAARVNTRRSERPLFLFLHTYLVHAPFEHDPRWVDKTYTGPFAGQTISNEIIEAFRDGTLPMDSKDRRYVSDLYDALVRRADDLVADFLTEVQDALGDNVLLIILSDHGEEFFERDLLAHGHSLYDELLAVPLVVRPPGPVQPGHDPRPASVVDVLPTILDAAGLPIPAHLPGHSLLAPAPDMRDRVGRFSGHAHALVHENWKLICGRVNTPRGPFPDPQLFDISVDPDETRDLVNERVDVRDRMALRLESYLARWQRPAGAGVNAAGHADASVRADLVALGYTDDLSEETDPTPDTSPTPAPCASSGR